MKHIYTLLVILFWLPASLCAQQTLLEKYQYAPNEYQDVFLDYVKNNKSTIITTTSGQYVGQVDENGLLCGYGMFINNDGSQLIGQFNKGKMLFGIKMLGENAIVGSANHYANYSMKTGYLDYILRGDDKQPIDGKGLYTYAFVAMHYPNGDQYVGEIYQRQRHGFGLYYYSNGDIWFGMYNKGIRQGYGVLFDKDNHLTIGCWDGEDVRRVIEVEEKVEKKRK